MGESPQCPVCRARFRARSTCTRCGADLTPLMVLAARAFAARCAARTALGRGRIERARDLARRAQRLRRTAAGEKLARFTADLARLVSADRARAGG